MTVNAQYNVAKANSLPVKVGACQRSKMFAAFLEAMSVSSDDTILDIGATSDQTSTHSLVSMTPGLLRPSTRAPHSFTQTDLICPSETAALTMGTRAPCWNTSARAASKSNFCTRPGAWRAAAFLLRRPTGGFRWSFISCWSYYTRCQDRFIASYS
jgi:hypothetical protein